MEKFVSSRIDDWLALFPTEDVEAEVSRLKNRLDEIQRSISELQDEHGIVALELTKAEQALMFREQLRGIETSQTAARRDAEKAPRYRGKSAVMKLFREASPGAELRADDVRGLMIAKGWMDDDEDTHSIQVALSRLARDDKLERVRYGVYRLPVAEEASAPMNVQGANGDGSEGHGDPRVVAEGHLLTLEGAPDEAHRAGS